MRIITLLALLALAGFAFGQSDYWSVYSPKPIYTTIEKPKTVLYFNSKTISLNIEVRYTSDVFPSKPFEQCDVLATYKRVFYRQSKSRETVADIPMDYHKAGKYIIKFTKGASERFVEFTVSNLGFVMKHDSEQMQFWIMDRALNKSVTEADVYAFNDSGKTLLGKSDENGFFSCPLVSSGSYIYIANSSQSASVNVNKNYIYKPEQVFIYTDRPIYRPGQVVSIKGIARKPISGGYENLIDKTVKVKIKGDNNLILFEKSLPTNSFGTFNTEYAMPSDIELGDYRIVVDCEGEVGTAFYEVAEYRKPEFTVSIISDKDMMIIGDNAKIRVKAAYFFGAPVKNAVVNWTASASEGWYGWYAVLPRDETKLPWEESQKKNYRDNNNWYYGNDGGIEFEGKGVTDSNGYLTIELPDSLKQKKITRPIELSIDAEVKDVAGRVISGSKTINILPGQIFSAVSAEEYVVKAGSVINCNIQSYQVIPIKPVSASVTVEVIKTEWIEKNDKWIEKRETIVAPKLLETDSAGKAKFTFTANNPGSVVVKVTTKDKQGRVSVDEDYVWVTSNDVGFWRRNSKSTLELVANKSVYQPGDVVRALITTKSKEATVWFTLEGSRLFESKCINITNNSATVEFPIIDAYCPNLMLSVCMVENGRIVQKSVNLTVYKPESILKISAEPEKDVYRPGEQANYRIHSADMNGNPAQTEFSFGLVDESIYAMRSDLTDNIAYWYWGRGQDNVSTQYTWSLNYNTEAPIPEPGSIQASLSENSVTAMGYSLSPLKRVKDDLRAKSVRKDFRDTAVWIPNVVSDENGNADVSVTLPDNLTEWRASVIGVTKDTAVGEGVSYIKASKPLVAQLELPRFVTEGDRFHIIGVIRSSSDKPETVTFKLNIGDGIFVGGTKEKTITIKPGSDARIDWLATAVSLGMVNIGFSAQGEIESDAMEVPLEVQPYSNIRLSSTYGATQGKSVSGEFELSDTTNPKRTYFEARMAPSLLSMAFDSAEALFRYPYGCIEQTTSPLYADLALYQAIKSMGLDMPEYEKKIDDAVKQSIAKISKMQSYDGGWGWGQYSSSDQYWTAYVLGALLLAKENGYAIPQYVFARANQRLSEQAMEINTTPRYIKKGKLKTPDPTYQTNLYTKVCCLDILSEIDPVGLKPAVERVYAQKADLSNVGLLRLSRSLRHIGEVDKAYAVLEEVKGMAQLSEDSAYWKSNNEQMWYYGEQDTYATALILTEIIQYDVDDPIVVKGLMWLTERRSDSYWASTNDTSQIVRLIADYSRLKDEKPFIGKATVAVNGKTVSSVDFTAASALNKEVYVKIPFEQLSLGTNQWTITPQGSGLLRFSLLNHYSSPYELTKPEAAGVSCGREYFKITREKVKRGTGKSAYYVDEVRLIPLTVPPTAGEEVAVKITLNADNSFRHIVVEDPIPAGLEPIDQAGSEYFYFTFVAPESAEYEYEYYGYSQREFHDNRVGMLVESVPQGKSTYWYVLRAVTPGDFRAAPPKAYNMYRPYIRGTGVSQNVEVRK